MRTLAVCQEVGEAHGVVTRQNVVPLESLLEVFAIPFMQCRPIIYLQSDNNMTMSLQA